jgi:putative membrane protein
MGAADIVPGVSGGTMAFILGIYEELIDSIRTFGTRPFLSAVLHLRIRQAYAMINSKFLLAVGGGIALAVLTLSHVLEYLLVAHPVFLWSFFFGLVLASVYVVSRRIRHRSSVTIASMVVGVVGAYLIVGLVPVETPEAPWFLLLSGAIAICAMILPGISGSFLLVLLGKYEFILQAVNERDLVSIGYIGAGAAVGIIAFSQVLSWLLHKHHDLTVAFLTGLMVGSLRKIWPWKISDGLLAEHNVLPDLTVQGALNMNVVSAVALIVLGFVVVIALELMATRGQQAH